MDENELRQLIDSLTGVLMTSDDLYEHLLEFVSLAFSVHANIQAIQDVQDRRQEALNAETSASYHLLKTTTPNSSRSSSPIQSHRQGHGDHNASHFKPEFISNMSQLDDLFSQIPRKADQTAGDLDNCQDIIEHYREKLAKQLKTAKPKSEKDSTTSSSVDSPADTGKRTIELQKKGLRFRKRVKRHNKPLISSQDKGNSSANTDMGQVPMLDLSHLSDDECIEDYDNEDTWKFPVSISDEQKALIKALKASSTKQISADLVPQFNNLSVNDIENYWEAPRTARQPKVETPKMFDCDFAKAILACSEEEECILNEQQSDAKDQAPSPVDQTGLYEQLPRSSYMGVGPSGEPALEYSDSDIASPSMSLKDNENGRPRSRLGAKTVKYTAQQLLSMSRTRQSRRTAVCSDISEKFPYILPSQGLLHSLDMNKTNHSGFYGIKPRTGPEYEDPLEGPSGLCRPVIKEEDEEDDDDSCPDSLNDHITVNPRWDDDCSPRTSCIESLDSSDSIEKISETSIETSAIESFNKSGDSPAIEYTVTPTRETPETPTRKTVEILSDYAVKELAEKLAKEEAIQIAIESAQKFAKEIVEKSAKEYANVSDDYMKYLDSSDEEEGPRRGGLPIANTKSCGLFAEAVANYDDDIGTWPGNERTSLIPEYKRGLSMDDNDAFNYYLPRVGEKYRPAGTTQRPTYIESRPSEIHFGCPPILEDPLEDTSAISASPNETNTDSLQDSTAELSYEQDELEPEFNSCQERSMVVSGIQTLTVSPVDTPLSDSFRRTQAQIEDAIYNLKVEMMRPTGAIPKRPKHISKKRKHHK